MSMSNRIQKLEDVLGVGARVLVLSQPRDMTDEQLERYLEARGISTRSDDLVVSLKRFGEGQPDPWVKIHDAHA
jgi:hypothetical protein